MLDLRALKVLAILLLLVLDLQSYGKDIVNCGLTDLVVGKIKQTIDEKPLDQVVDDYTRNLVTPPLVILDENWRWKCQVCTHLPSEENNTIKISYSKNKVSFLTQWEIKPDYFWADGRPVTGYDVEYTIGHLRRNWNREVGKLPYFIEKIEVDKKNPRKFTLVFNNVDADFFQLLAIPLLPGKSGGQGKAVYEEIFANAEQPNLAQAGLYYGNYFVVEHNEDFLRLHKNPFMEGAKGLVEKIVIRSYAQKTELIKNLFNKVVNVIPEGELSLADLAVLEEKLKKNEHDFQIIEVASNSFEHLVINSRNPLFADIRVRQALMHAINFEKILHDVYAGHGMLATQILHEKDELYLAPKIKYNYDPEMSEKLLKKVGWEKGKKGIRIKEGKELRLEVVTVDESIRVSTLEAIKKDLAAVGIEMEMRKVDIPTFKNDIVARVRFRDLVLLSWTGNGLGLLWSGLHSSQIPSSNNENPGYNTAGWTKREVDSALELLSRSRKSKNDPALISTIQHHYLTDLPTIPILFKNVFAVVPRCFRKYVVPGHQYKSSIFRDNWLLP